MRREIRLIFESIATVENSMFALLSRIFVTSLTCLALVACVTTPQLMDPRGSLEPDLTHHGVVVMSMDMENRFSTDWPVSKLGGRFTGRAYDPQKKENTFFEGSLSYFPGPLIGMGDGVKKGRKDMVSVVILPAGTYRMTSIVGSSIPGLLGGAIHFPVFSDEFVVRPGKGIYLGHVGIVVREKSASDKVRLDELVGRYKYLGDPGLGQAMTKFTLATPVLRVTNRFDASIVEAKADYPYLRSVVFENTPIRISLDGSLASD